MLKIKENRTTKKRIYYNVSIPHDDSISVAGSPTPAVYSDVRTSPILDGKPKDWYLSVVRFTVPTSYIPIQFFPIEENPADPNDVNFGIYSVTMTYLGVDYQQHLEWITQDAGAPVPPPGFAIGINDRSFQINPDFLFYYSLFSFNHFCTLINNALSVVFTTNILPLLPPPPIGTAYQAPFMTYDSVSKLFTLHTQNIFLDTAASPINIYFNTFLNENFDTSFDNVYFPYTAPNGKNVRFVLLDRIVNREPDSTSPGGFTYAQSQEFETSGQMTSFTSLIIRSNSLPINNEMITIQRRGGIGNTGIDSNTESMITDFEIDLGTIDNMRSFIHYVPTAEYRRVNLNGETPIDRIDLQILWKDNYDNIYPVLIPAHDIATVKILFEEK